MDTNFEKDIESLQLRLKHLESGQLSLEDCIKEFEEGIATVKRCQLILKEAELRVKQLTATGDFE